MELRIAFVGFGNVARAFARMSHAMRPRLARDYAMAWRTTAIATANHGSIISDSDIDLKAAAAYVERGESLRGMPGSAEAADAAEVIARAKADIIFETTPLDPINGEPATTYIRDALSRSMSVVTANKGPVAFAYRELKALAREKRASFRFEGTVMDGAPVFNLIEHCLPGARVTGFSGVLNSTTNVILSGMEDGRSFDECLEEARRLGIAEAKADYDLDGWDASVKAVAIANVLMGADLRPRDVERTGIRGVSMEQARLASESGKAIRLIARGVAASDGVRLSVRPEVIQAASRLGSLAGTSNALVIETDLMGGITVVESDPGVEQTAYALLSDMIRVNQEMAARGE
jgi:homoserine dehydrogenase